MKEVLPPRKMRLCLEGWYYLLVLSFIAAAAVLRAANLLLILAAMLIVPLLFNWQFVMASMRKLTLWRKLPKQIVAGEKFRVQLTIENGRRSLDSWRVLVEESIIRKGVPQSARTVVILDRVQAGQKQSVSYQGLLMDRGEYILAPSIVSTTFPLGLLRASTTVPNRESIFVTPRLGELGNDWLLWAKPDEVDEPRSVGQKGINDGLFYAIRDYRSGDSRRSIHWRSTAKLGRPAVKQFERQNEEELNLILDLWTGSPSDESKPDNQSSPDQPIGSDGNQSNDGEVAPKRTDDPGETAVSFVSTILNQFCQSGRCELNCLLLGDKESELSGKASRKFQREVNQSLAVIQPVQGDDSEERIKRFLQQHQVRGPALIVTTRDFNGDSGQQPPATIAMNHGEMIRCHWISVHDPDFAKMFYWKEDRKKTSDPGSRKPGIGAQLPDQKGK